MEFTELENSPVICPRCYSEVSFESMAQTKREDKWGRSEQETTERKTCKCGDLATQVIKDAFGTLVSFHLKPSDPAK